MSNIISSNFLIKVGLNASNWVSCMQAYTEAQLKECLEEYAALNVWQIDPNTFDIHFIDA
jgi:DNA replication licensing factor MCM7